MLWTPRRKRMITNRYRDQSLDYRVEIYALIDPTNRELFYIGKTRRELVKRLYGHVSQARKGNPTKTSQRIRSILSEGSYPEIIRIGVTNAKEWHTIENEYIKVFREDGYDLTNMIAGGGGE